MFKNWFRSIVTTNAEEGPMGSALLISDDRNHASYLCNLLETEGYESYLTTNLDETLRMLDTIPMPGVIICDFKRPDIDGREIIHKIRVRFGRTALPPLVFLYDTIEDEAAAHVLNADEVVPKSPDAAALVERLHLLIFERQPKTRH